MYGAPPHAQFQRETRIIKTCGFPKVVKQISLCYYELSSTNLYLVKKKLHGFIIFHISMKYVCCWKFNKDKEQVK